MVHLAAIGISDPLWGLGLGFCPKAKCTHHSTTPQFPAQVRTGVTAVSLFAFSFHLLFTISHTSIFFVVVNSRWYSSFLKIF